MLVPSSFSNQRSGGTELISESSFSAYVAGCSLLGTLLQRTKHQKPHFSIIILTDHILLVLPISCVGPEQLNLACVFSKGMSGAGMKLLAWEGN